MFDWYQQLPKTFFGFYYFIKVFYFAKLLKSAKQVKLSDRVQLKGKAINNMTQIKASKLS